MIDPETLYPGDDQVIVRGHYVSAMEKLREAAARFVGERDRHFLKNFRGNGIDPEEFRDQLRRSVNCRLSAEEMRAIVPLMDKNNSGTCDGAEFLIIFYRIRHEIRCENLTNRINAEKKIKEKISERLTRRQRTFESMASVELPDSYTEEDKRSAIAKITAAAARYDRLMPGTVQLDAFEGRIMSPTLFREQLKSVFNMKTTLGELAALMDFFDSNKDGYINCAEFLIHFFRAGFAERTRQLEEERFQRMEYAKEQKRKHDEEEEARAKKNALKVDYIYDKTTKDRAYEKLRAAAMLYNKDSCGAVNMNAFEGAFMPPHVFKEQLRRVFNLHVTPKELGALMDLFDKDKDGAINCTEFILVFAKMGAEERALQAQRQREKQAQDTERRRLAEEAFQKEQEKRNKALVDYEFGEDDYSSAMDKLTEAAWRYDSTMPGAPSVAGFQCKSQKPHEFKEQLKRVFNITVTPKELGALITYFDKSNSRNIDCAEFLIEFVRIGAEERNRQKKEYLAYQKSKEMQRKMRMEQKERQAEMKNNLKLENNFDEGDFNSAMSKMTTAAFYYDRSSPGAVQLDAFEAESMLPHVFKEQLKRTLNLRVTPRELGALMSYFDKQGTGRIKCSEFLIEFFRLGFNQRNKMRADFRKLKKEQAAREKKFQEEKLAESLRRGEAEIDFEFTEEDFDSALTKLIETCHRFDQRQLGPAGWRAFQTDKLSPTEYRELMKQTFDMRITPQELGALVTYFDVDFSGMVSCSAFLNSFTQIRVNIEPHKGKPGEAKFHKEYHAKLKEVYKARIQKQLMSENILVKKPWRNGIAPPDHASRKVLKKRQPPPKTAEEKIQLRIAVAKRSGRLDLASDAVKRLPSEFDSSVTSVSDVSSTSERLIDRIPPQTENINETFLTGVEGKENNSLKTAGGGDLSSSLDKATVYFQLSSLPENAFKIKGLTELWLCNNMLGNAGAEERERTRCRIQLSAIGQLTNLTVLSLQGNDISSLPEEFGNLENLQRLYLQKNRLHQLPASVKRLRNLTEFNLSYNELTAFPDAVFSMPCLTILNLSNNPGMLEIPDELKTCRSINILDLSGIAFTCPPPVLSRLHWMFVSIDNLRPPSRGSFYRNSVVAFEPSYDEETEFLDFLNRRVKAAAIKKRDNKMSSPSPSKSPKKISKRGQRT